ncbi:2-dehydro-3-deoxy-D-gluconate 5-dehydrogenase [bioreactor metagenome]|uniref:2-dehydro-3-deoxy-D-gluconate 5-dehydrogenase n=1 Tax=bioreactor metagenome TaxID=1076179 RepID=A0A645ERB6_9ZZZZ
MAAAAKQAGGVDILVNSAAVTNRKTLVEMTEAEWDRIITTNLYGAYRVGKAVAQLMIEQGRSGRMIFIVSTGAYRAGVNFGAYSASKAGVVMLMKTFALELAPHGILCNAIAPTATDTNFTADYYQQFPEKREAVIKNHPLGRIARAEDYQGTVVYLASKAAEFVTGTMLVVDGGKTAK